MKLAKPLRLSVKVVIRDKNNNCLVLRRSAKSRGNPGKWDFPGGKVDFGEQFDQTLFREVKEETGLSIRIKGVLGTTQSESPKAKFVYVIMEAELKSGRVQLSSEHEEFQWVKISELPEIDLAEQFKSFARMYAAQQQEVINSK